ncbi:MAG: glycosyl hydrolase, partial [Polaribacter sp.]
DDLTPLHQLNTSTKEEVILYKPKNAYNLSGGRGRTSRTAGTNHPGGVAINYFIKEKSTKDVVSLSFYDKNNNHIKTFSTKPNKEQKDGKLTVKDGNNIFYWNMMYDGAESVKGMILWWASLSGPMALPGNYKVELAVNDKKMSANFNILRNPMSEASENDMKAQFDFINDIN